jgi:hypothetical protein
VHSWSRTVDERVLERRYPGIGDLRTIAITGRDGNGDYGGRVQSLVLVGSKGRQSLSGGTFQSLFGLRSTWFDLR